jgi:hypothetical protein
MRKKYADQDSWRFYFTTLHPNYLYSEGICKMDCLPEEATIRSCCTAEFIRLWTESAIAVGYSEDEVPLDFPLLLPEDWLDVWDVTETTKLQLLCE